MIEGWFDGVCEPKGRLQIWRAIEGWMAGIIDGEGTLTIAKQIRRDRPSPAFRVVVDVANTDRRLLVPFKRYYGGGIYPRPERRKSKRWKDSWTWHCFDGRQREFLLAVRPHLRGKRRQADLLLEFIEHKESFPRKSLGQGKGSAPLGSAELRFRERLWNRVRVLNEKGPTSRSRRLQ